MSKQEHEKYEETQSGTIDISDIKEPYSHKLVEADFSNHQGNFIVFEKGISEQHIEDEIKQALEKSIKDKMDKEIIEYFSALPDKLKYTVKKKGVSERIIILDGLNEKAIIEMAFYLAYTLRQPFVKFYIEDKKEYDEIDMFEHLM